ncbi:MAG: tyrosine-type recombinase/integrase [Candidatus Paceibacterota bacterium]
MEQANKPIKDLIPDFLEYLEIEKNLSEETQENYHRSLKKFVNWLKKNNLEDLKPHELTPEHIWKYRVHLSRYKSDKTNEKLKKSSQHSYLVALRTLLNFFAHRDIDCIPAEKIELPKTSEDENKVKFLNLEQVKQLLEAPDTDTKTGIRDRAILETLFSTGMRVAELVSLNREQLNIKPETEDLEISIVGKGDRPRTVYFSERCIKWLRKYLETRDDDSEALFRRYRGPKDASLRLTPRSIDNIVKKYVKKAGLPSFTTPHTLRHSFATDLLAQGVDLRVVQEFLGHKNVATTQIYTHVTNKKLRDIHKEYHSGDKLEE